MKKQKNVVNPKIDSLLSQLMDMCDDKKRTKDGQEALGIDVKLDILDRATKWEQVKMKADPEELGTGFEKEPDDE